MHFGLCCCSTRMCDMTHSMLLCVTWLVHHLYSLVWRSHICQFKCVRIFWSVHIEEDSFHVALCGMTVFMLLYVTWLIHALHALVWRSRICKIMHFRLCCCSIRWVRWLVSCCCVWHDSSMLCVRLFDVIEFVGWCMFDCVVAVFVECDDSFHVAMCDMTPLCSAFTCLTYSNLWDDACLTVLSRYAYAWRDKFHVIYMWHDTSMICDRLLDVVVFARNRIFDYIVAVRICMWLDSFHVVMCNMPHPCSAFTCLI